MKLKYAITVLTILQTVFGFQLKAQSASADSSVFLSGISNVTALYHKATGEQSHLYNGIEYVGYPFRLDKGHLYFEKNELSRGTVRYDGVQYENIPMMYDLTKGELVIIHHANNLRVQLIKDKVESFSLFGHTFKKIEQDMRVPTSLPSEFYDVLYEGKITLLAQREKQILETATTSGLKRNVNDNIDYYLLIEDNYHKFNGKKALLKLLKDKHKKLKSYIRENKIKYKRDREGSMVRIARFYDQLNL